MIGKEILNYRIVSLIGRGGMGSVYLAEHKFISAQKVAIKVINSDMVNDYTRSRLKEEAEHLAGLKHNNIVTFHDYHIDEQGNIYLIMEYADGKSLADYIRTQSGLIVQERVCPLFEPILDAVGYAHKHNIIHRDIKPSNVVITTDGTPKMLDFGIATFIKKEKEESENIIVGTPSYMSPEQVRGEHLDERSDIYSLGVMLHEMLTGNPPYDTTTLTALDINKKILDEPLPRVRTFYKYTSESVQKVIDKATAKNPKDRYQSCAEFKRALHDAVYPPKVSRTWLYMAAGILLLLAAGGVYYWDYNRIKVEYFKDYTEQYGIPVGIGKVTEEIQHQRGHTYKFESRQRKVRRVSCINCKGNLCTQNNTEFGDRPAQQEIYYSDNGHVDFIKIIDQFGKVLYRMDYNDNLSVVTLQYDDKYNTEFTLGNMDALSRDLSISSDEKSKISRYLLTYDENGYVIKKEYAGLYNKKAGDKNGVYAHLYKVDEQGRVIEDQYIGRDGEPKVLENGLNIRTYAYDENDNWIETKYLTSDYSASKTSHGITIIKLEYDEYGNRTGEKYYDFDNNLTYRTDDYYVAGINEEVQNGLTVSMTYIDMAGNPCATKDGSYKVVLEYDENGYPTRYSTLDENDKPLTTTDGYATQRHINGPKGEVLEWWLYDENDSLTCGVQGNAGYVALYDSVGNTIQMITYDENRVPVNMNAYSNCGWAQEFNDKNQCIKYTNIDGDGHPAPDEYGICIERITYDEQGHIIQREFYDANDSTLVLHKSDGIAGYNDIYDENGNMIKREFFGVDHEPVLYENYMASYTFEYNENNYRTSEAYYGLNGEKVSCPQGFHKVLYEYDSRGNKIKETPFTTDGKLPKGQFILCYKFNESDLRTEFAVFETGMKAVIGKENAHRCTYTYDNKGQITEIRYYDTKGQLTYNTSHYAIERVAYDNKGQNIEASCFGTDEQPCLCKDGYYTVCREYDRFGRKIKESYYDTEGYPIKPTVMAPVAICDYDKYGNINYVAAQDGNGHFIINPQVGSAIIRMVWDNKGNNVETSYFDQNDKPMIKKNFCHTVRRTYNLQGKVIQEAYYNCKDEPMLIEGVHLVKKEYDKNGYLQTERYFGKNGKPVNHKKGGFHKCTFSYKENGEQTYMRAYSTNGKLIVTMKNTKDGWKLDNSSNLSTDNSWQERVEMFNAQLPYDTGESYHHFTMVYIKVTSPKSCSAKYTVALKSDEIDDDTMTFVKNFAEGYTQYFFKEMIQTGGVRVNAELFSKDGKLLHTVVYEL